MEAKQESDKILKYDNDNVLSRTRNAVLDYADFSDDNGNNTEPVNDNDVVIRKSERNRNDKKRESNSKTRQEQRKEKKQDMTQRRCTTTCVRNFHLSSCRRTRVWNCRGPMCTSRC